MGAKLIIGVAGKAGHGKDAAVKAIMSERSDTPFSLGRIGFADDLKQLVYGREAELCAQYGIEHQAGTKCPKLLQVVGEQYRRKNPFHWVNLARTKIEQASETIILVPDVRFRNELNYILSTGGYCLKVIREGYISPDRDPLHKSEVDLDDVDFTKHKSERTGQIICGEGETEQLRKLALTWFDDVIESLDYSKYFDNQDFTVVV